MRNALGDAATQIADAKLKSELTPILPPQEVTHSTTNVSHHLISDSDLMRLKHSVRSRVSPFFELAAGTLLGNLPAALISIARLHRAGLTTIDVADVVVVGFALISFGFTLALGIVGLRRRGESAEAICDEIAKRERGWL